MCINIGILKIYIHVFRNSFINFSVHLQMININNMALFGNDCVQSKNIIHLVFFLTEKLK